VHVRVVKGGVDRSNNTPMRHISKSDAAQDRDAVCRHTPDAWERTGRGPCTRVTMDRGKSVRLVAPPPMYIGLCPDIMSARARVGCA
jgi:hypothetical protein